MIVQCNQINPWVFGSPYFGSWGHKFIIPDDQINKFKSKKKIE